MLSLLLPAMLLPKSCVATADAQRAPAPNLVVISSTSFSATWMPVTRAVAYDIGVRPAGATEFVLRVGNTTASVTGLLSDSTAEVRVRPVIKLKAGAWSKSAVIKLPSSSPAPPDIAFVIAPTTTMTVTTEPPSPVITSPPPVVQPVTVQPVTIPPTTVPSTTVLPVTVPPTTALPVTVPPTTVPRTTVPATVPATVPPTTVPPTTVPATVPPPTVPPATVPPTTAPPTTVPGSVTHGRDLTKSMVGPRVPAAQVFTTRQTITVPGVYAAIDYQAGVDVRVAGVSFVDCRFSSTNVADSAVVFTNKPGTVFRYSEVDGKSRVYVAIKAENGADGLVIEHSYMHHVGHGLNTSAVSWRMTESWIDNIVAPDPAPYPGDELWHADGILSWGSNTLAERNVIDLGFLSQTAAVNHGTWSGSGAVSNVTYRDNVLAGGGYAVYFEERSYPLTGLTVVGNDLRTGSFGYVYAGARPARAPVWTNNRRPDGSLVNW